MILYLRSLNIRSNSLSSLVNFDGFSSKQEKGLSVGDAGVSVGNLSVGNLSVGNLSFVGRQPLKLDSPLVRTSSCEHFINKNCKFCFFRLKANNSLSVVSKSFCVLL
jgi:hypothetical protein